MKYSWNEIKKSLKKKIKQVVQEILIEDRYLEKK